MTPLGHTAISYIASKFHKNFSPLLFIAGGVVPDIDFIFLPFSFFNSIHRVITHNLLFLLLASCIVYFFNRYKTVNTVYFAAGFLLHLLADSILDSNSTNGIGIAILYPFSDFMFSPFNLASDVKSNSGWKDIGEMAEHTFKLVIYELPFWGIALFFYLKNRKQNPKNNSVTP